MMLIVSLYFRMGERRSLCVDLAVAPSAGPPSPRGRDMLRGTAPEPAHLRPDQICASPKRSKIPVR
jgi:hypothetical protein